MGPHCAGIFDPRSWGAREHQITLEVMRIVLATGLFAIGVELPKSYLAKHAKGLVVMVVCRDGIVLLFIPMSHQLKQGPDHGIRLARRRRCAQIRAVSSHTDADNVFTEGILHGLFPNLNFNSCLAISACLTPTDPIISAAIVGMPCPH